jgi:hypothetical protein
VHFKAIQADGFKTLKEGQLLLSSLPAARKACRLKKFRSPKSISLPSFQKTRLGGFFYACEEGYARAREGAAACSRAAQQGINLR